MPCTPTEHHPLQILMYPTQGTSVSLACGCILKINNQTTVPGGIGGAPPVSKLPILTLPHIGMSTLTLIWRDDSQVEYLFNECKDEDGLVEYDFQWWPHSSNSAYVVDNIHSIEWHYERRLQQVPEITRGPSLEYASIANCGYSTSAQGVRDCLNNYSSGGNGLPGIDTSLWEVAAFMNHQFGGDDNDPVVVYENTQEQDVDGNNFKKCILSFSGSESLTGDLGNFLLWNSGTTGYCGRYGVHIGVRNELWQITHDEQWASVIKPQLETCHEVVCVGHSLGGALCNVFTMCANQGEENLDEADDVGMWDDFDALAWTKASDPSTTNPPTTPLTTNSPVVVPTTSPPTVQTTPGPTSNPTSNPTKAPSTHPTNGPTQVPTSNPTPLPTGQPVATPGPTSPPTTGEVSKTIVCGRGYDEDKTCPGGLKGTALVNETHEIRCCRDCTGINCSKPWKEKCPDYKAELFAISKVGGVCKVGTFSVALAFCRNIEGADARLCTPLEMENGCAQGTGCKFDQHQIWTCAYDGHACEVDAECCGSCVNGQCDSLFS